MLCCFLRRQTLVGGVFEQHSHHAGNDRWLGDPRGGRFNISFQSYYVQDTWKVNNQLTLEGAAYYDKLDNANPFDGTERTVQSLNPRFGVIANPTSRDTLRLAAGRYLAPFLAPRLDPTDVAGIPVFNDQLAGSRKTEIAGAWEHLWPNDIFTSLSAFYSEREFKRQDKPNLDDRSKGVDLDYSQLLGDRFGLSAGYRYLHVHDDVEPSQDPLTDVNRKDHRLRLGLRYVRPDGISAGVAQTLRRINNDNTRDDETIWITDANIAYEFSGKRGTVRLDLLKVFDNKFKWVTDRFVLRGREPGRQILFSLSLSF